MKNIPLGDMSLDMFFNEYWQKKPLLIRNAFPACQPVIAGDVLAGLACEEGVESRLVIRDEGGERWELQHGPFSDETFLSLPPTHWTLLVQAVDHWVPAAADFLQQFTFIPSWRIDDLMISYASDGGGVGPHYDNYDVFLIQAAGRRRWEVGGYYDDNSPCRSDTPVKVLTDWQTEQTWDLDPGDMLYVPPRVGHSGIALGDRCMTYSVGFRAPSHKDILQEFSSYVGHQLSEEVRYCDPEYRSQDNPGHITTGALRIVHQILRRYVDNQALLAEWFGRAMTMPKYPVQECESEIFEIQEVREQVLAGHPIHRNEGSRFAFQEHEKDTWLFVDGQSFSCTHAQAPLVRMLCAERIVDPASFSHTQDNFGLLVQLLNQGSVYFPD